MGGTTSQLKKLEGLRLEKYLNITILEKGASQKKVLTSVLGCHVTFNVCTNVSKESYAHLHYFLFNRFAVLQLSKILSKGERVGGGR